MSMAIGQRTQTVDSSATSPVIIGFVIRFGSLLEVPDLMARGPPLCVKIIDASNHREV
ncbi:hypothetical protein M404DRAFT_1008241 [Pisolithus tinctorius Marx 270]|uniref:Uncharacterized protein n=1 Tax=Pisolithus tinctorius Marx 270 TaxID=870435 RepID=A0A0C3JA47_PISTI|nr:hypothetical protein M404DRAFT_1008241 [Pisolithus tinctorius Marx 270]